MMKKKSAAYKDVQACAWMGQVAEGLLYLHSSNPKVFYIPFLQISSLKYGHIFHLSPKDCKQICFKAMPNAYIVFKFGGTIYLLNARDHFWWHPMFVRADSRYRKACRDRSCSERKRCYPPIINYPQNLFSTWRVTIIESLYTCQSSTRKLSAGW